MQIDNDEDLKVSQEALTYVPENIGSSEEVDNETNWFSKLLVQIRRRTTFGIKLIVVYLLIIIISSLILWAPISHDKTWENSTTNSLPFIDAMFVATASFSNTGMLSNVNAAMVFNSLGIFVLIVLMIIGGIGFFALKLLIINIILKKALNYETMINIQNERGSYRLGSSVSILKVAIIAIFSAIFIFSGIFTIIYYFTTPDVVNFLMQPKPNWSGTNQVPAFIIADKDNSYYFDSITNSWVEITLDTKLKDIIQFDFFTQQGIIIPIVIQESTIGEAFTVLEPIAISQGLVIDFSTANYYSLHYLETNVNQLYIQLMGSGSYGSNYLAINKTDYWDLYQPGSYVFYCEIAKGDFWQSMSQGIFTSVASINNSGIDILSENSFSPYYGNWFLQFNIIILTIFGGIGFPVIYDLYQYFKFKSTGKRFQFSLLSKISLSFYFIVGISGFLVVLGIEAISILDHGSIVVEWQGSGTFESNIHITSYESFDDYLNDVITNGGQEQNAYWSLWANNSYSAPFLSEQSSFYYGTYWERCWALVFNSAMTRSTGFSTINIYDLTILTTLVYTGLMFIGSSPSSTSGGIRTTTFCVAVFSLVAYVRNHRDVTIYRRRVSSEQVKETYVIILFSIILILCSTAVIMVAESFNSENQWSQEKYGELVSVFFMVSSAFGTSGLSLTYQTASWSVVSKLILMVTMLIGQLGLANTLHIYASKDIKEVGKYPNEVLIFG